MLPARADAPETAFPPTALPWLLTSLVLAVLPLAGQLPAWVTAGFVGCACWRQFAERGGGRALPSLRWRLALFGAAAVGVFFFGRGRVAESGDPEVLTAFLVALISLKIMELRTAREFALLALLGYFLLLACFFSGQGLTLALYVAGVAVVNTAALARCHAVEVRGASRVRAGGPSLRLGFGLMAQAIPLAVVAFVLFPRLEGKLFGRRLFLGEPVSRTGISDHLSPGDISRLERSDAVAFRAVLNDGETLLNKSLYWRALTLSACEKSGLDWSAGVSNNPRVAGLPVPVATGGGSGQLTRQTVTLFGDGGTWLAALDRPLNAPAQATANPLTGDLIAHRVVDGTIVYQVDSAVTAGGGGGGGVPVLPDPARAAFLAVPNQLGKRARALALGWRAAAETNGGGAKEIINAGLRFFQENGFTYTLEPDPYGFGRGGNALEAFLFQRRQGFCEHYAAAFATLMRAAGLPARVVVGFQGGTWNPLGAHYVIRQADAHAWTEIWLDGRGWRRVDPTSVVAPDRLSFGAESFASLGGTSGEERLARVRRLADPPLWLRALRGVRFTWDTVDQAWNTRVVDYSEKDQRHLVARVGLGAMDWVTALGTLAAVAAGVLLLGLVLATAAARGRELPGWLRRLLRFLGERGVGNARALAVGSEGVHAREAAGHYARFCRRLSAGARLERAAGEGPLDFAARAAGSLAPEPARAAGEIAQLYATARYGKPERAGETVPALRRAVRKFRVKGADSS